MTMRLSLAAALALIAASLAGCQASVATPEPAAGAVPRDPATIERGRALAIIGGCASCHTATGGKPYAGGVAISLPVGTLYSTNITPDKETGIGQWSEADFQRAMREGVARDGRRLYPAFPYDHFTHLQRDDVSALYAFLMSREPVHADSVAERLVFPFGIRPLLAAWDALYLHPAPWRSDPAQSAQWNRGAYLAEALAHCGACHTPRNLLLAEQSGRAYDGAESEGWDAPPLNGKASAPIPWSEEQLFNYLRRGTDDVHGSAAGPMADVVQELAQAPEDDVRAIAVYFASLMKNAGASAGAPSAANRLAGAKESSVGAAIFEGACAECHGTDSPRTLAGRPVLGLTTSVNARSPRNAIQVVLQGMQPAPGERGPYMPGYASILSDAQIAAVLAYVRERYTGRPAWSELADETGNIRRAQ